MKKKLVLEQDGIQIFNDFSSGKKGDIFSFLMLKEGKTFYLILLKASGEKKKEVVNEKWKLIINTEIEFEN